MTAKQYRNDPTVLEMDDQNESSNRASSELPWEVESEFEDLSNTRSNWSSWEDDTSDGSGGSYGFLE